MTTMMRTTAGLLLGLLLTPAAQAGSDGDEISRSRGKKGGVVVLYPRLVPATTDPAMAALAEQLQQRMAASASRAVGERPVDVRPAPERVCPQQGCKAASVGLFVGHSQGGCAVVAMVGSPGPANQQLLPLAGTVHLQSAVTTFRQPPERLVTVTEFLPCDQVVGALELTAVESAIASAAATP
jgi:hypothetical protein